MKSIKKVSIIGMGAMGAYFAPRLEAVLGDGLRVVAAGKRKDRLESRGVTVNSKVYHFPIIDPCELNDPADIIIVAVKGYDLDQAIQDIYNQVGPDTQILPVMNGVDSEEKLMAVYGTKHVLYSYMRVSVVMRDGKTEYDPGLGTVYFGEERNEEERYSERVLAVKELFDRSGIRYSIDSDMKRGIWFKFMCNVGENLTCALLGIPFGMYHTSEHANYIRTEGMREVLAIAQARGIDLKEEDIDRQEATLRALPAANKPSTLQDLEAGRKTEIDMFAGRVMEFGEKLGILTPVNALLYHGIKVLEEKNEYVGS